MKANASKLSWIAYQKYISSIVLPADNGKPRDISYWRNATFAKLIIYIAPIGLLALIPGVYMSFKMGFVGVGIADIFAFIFLLIIMVSRSLTMAQRKIIFLGIFYFLSLVLIYNLIISGVGMLYPLLALTVITGIIYSARAAYLSALVNTVICAGFALLFHFNESIPNNNGYTTASWITVSSNLVLLSFICVKCLTLLLEGLEANIREKSTAEMRLLLATKSAGMGIWEWDLKTGLLAFDDGMFLLYDITSLEFGSVYDSWLSRLHPEDRDETNENIQKALNDQKQYNTRFRIVWKDTSIHYIRATGIVERDASGEAIRMIGANWDVTDKVEQQEKLSISQANLRAIIDNTEASIYSLDREFRYITFNNVLKARVKRSFNIDIKAGDVVFDFLERSTPSKAMEWRNIYAEALTGKSMKFEKEFSGGGDFRVTSFSIKPIIENNEVIGLSCFAVDITESKKAELAIKELNESLQAANIQQASILDTLPANIALLDYDGVIMEVNDGWKQFASKSNIQNSDYFVGYNYIELCEKAAGDDAPDARHMAAGIRTVINGSVSNYELEYPCDTPDGAKWFKAEVRPLDRGKQIGVVVMHINITERKLAEIALNELNNDLEMKVRERTAELENANKELETFSYAVSHDLKAPIRAIIGFIKIIKTEYIDTLNEDVKGMFGYIETSSKRMGQIIDDLLILAKYGKEKLVFSEVDLSILFRDVWGLLLLASPHQAKLELGQMPIVYGDRSMLQQVVVNMLSNAIKYSSKKEDPEIKVGYTNTAGSYTIYVKDNGAGFDMKYYDKLFGAFQRLHGEAEFEGTGVGLMLTKKIIDRHGGTVWAEGKVDEGATFYFSLPIAA